MIAVPQIVRVPVEVQGDDIEGFRTLRFHDVGKRVKPRQAFPTAGLLVLEVRIRRRHDPSRGVRGLGGLGGDRKQLVVVGNRTRPGVVDGVAARGRDFHLVPDFEHVHAPRVFLCEPVHECPPCVHGIDHISIEDRFVESLGDGCARFQARRLSGPLRRAQHHRCDLHAGLDLCIKDILPLAISEIEGVELVLIPLHVEPLDGPPGPART